MLRYVCDVCGKELAASKEGLFQVGQNPPEWATIMVGLPRKSPCPSQAGLYPYEPPINFIVCSQTCAEKALDEAKEHLRKGFEGRHV